VKPLLITKRYSIIKNYDITFEDLKRGLRDPTSWSLLTVNLLTILLALFQNWNFLVLVWIFWFQNIIVGFFNFLRILTLKNENLGKRIVYAFGFFLHYGGIHLAYAIFLFVITLFNRSTGILVNDILFALLSIVLFFFNHLFSFLKNLKRDRKEDIKTLMKRPYLRVIPIHIVVLFALFLPFSVSIVFLLLKTFVDLLTHISEHYGTRAKN